MSLSPAKSNCQELGEEYIWGLLLYFFWSMIRHEQGTSRYWAIVSSIEVRSCFDGDASWWNESEYVLTNLNDVQHGKSNVGYTTHLGGALIGGLAFLGVRRGRFRTRWPRWYSIFEEEWMSQTGLCRHRVLGMEKTTETSLYITSVIYELLNIHWLVMRVFEVFICISIKQLQTFFARSSLCYLRTCGYCKSTCMKLCTSQRYLCTTLLSKPLWRAT